MILPLAFKIKKLIYSVLLVIVYTLCTGCSTEPVYKTFYNYVAPSTTSGQTCVNTCETNRLLCEQRVDAKQQRCQQDAESQYQQCYKDTKDKYNACLSDLQRQYGVNWSKYQTNCSYYHNVNNCRKTDCYRNSNCKSVYTQCFKSCGGIVKADTRCVSHCDKVK